MDLLDGESLPDIVGTSSPKVDGLRRRNKATQRAAEAKASEDSKVIQQLKKLDFHPKSEKAASTRAQSGGVVTVLALVLMFLLFLSETSDFLRKETQHTLHVDIKSSNQRPLPVYIDISFYQIPCFSLSLDVLDADGEQMSNTAHSIKRTRIDGNGVPIGHLTQEVLGSSGVTGPKWKPPQGYCGPCYVTSEEPKTTSLTDAPLARRNGPVKCCNSCFDLKREFLAAGLDIQQAERSEQCLRERESVVPEKLEGCRIEGSFEIRRTKGNFHVAAGDSQTAAHSHHKHHFHRITKHDIANFNVSHFIHHLQFGRRFFGLPESGLNGHELITDKLVQAKYLINIVPTEFHRASNDFDETYQFAATYHALPIDLEQNHYPLPGCFFHFDFSELRIQYDTVGKSFTQYLLRLCSSIGGIFVSIGLVYQLASNFKNRLQARR